MRKLAAWIILALLMSGCVTGRMGPQPLSKRWANEERQRLDVQARRERIGKPLFGGKGTAGEDNPFAIGGVNGLHAEIEGLGGGSLQYRFNW